MPGFISNLSPGEFILVAVVAILIFGRRLPEVVGEGMRQFARLKRQLQDIRQETGIDQDLRDMQRTVRKATTIDMPELDAKQGRPTPPRASTGAPAGAAAVKETPESPPAPRADEG